MAALEADGLARCRHRERNGGKGAAVQTGLRLARELDFTHAVQVDADGQHRLADLPRLLEAARRQPDALILGRPVFDDSAPRSRRIARLISKAWVDVETGGAVIGDPLCGFRVYPVEAAIAARPRARRMGHDPEIAVKLYWQGLDVVNLDTEVRYLGADQGGVSHYRMVGDNLEMTWVHTRLCNQMVARLAWRWLRRRRR